MIPLTLLLAAAMAAVAAVAARAAPANHPSFTTTPFSPNNQCTSGGEQCCAGLCSGACSLCPTCAQPCSHCKTCCDQTCDCGPFCATSLPQPLNATSLPNVLLVGDSISGNGTGYLANVQAMLGPSASSATGGGAVGNAAVQSGPGYGKNYCGTSFGLLRCLTSWVEAGLVGFDVIHFNWGLHDICPKMYVAVSPAQYASNMEASYQQLKRMLAPNGTLIWATTTPVPPSYKNRNNTDVVRINAQMQALFGPGSKHPDVELHDLYSEVVHRCNRDAASAGYPATSDCTFLQDNGVHFSAAGRQFTGIQVAAIVARAL